MDEWIAAASELIKKSVGWIQELATNQGSMLKDNRKLRVRVGSLETRCELQDAQIELLDERISAACGMLNLE